MGAAKKPTIMGPRTAPKDAKRRKRLLPNEFSQNAASNRYIFAKFSRMRKPTAWLFSG